MPLALHTGALLSADSPSGEVLSALRSLAPPVPCTDPRRVAGTERAAYALEGEVVRARVGLVGSDAATTCVVCAVRDPAARVIAAGHFDESCADGAYDALVVSALGGHPAGGLELFLCGARESADDTTASELSARVLCAVVRGFARAAGRAELRAALVLRGWSSGIAVSAETGQSFAARFEDRGPALSFRGSRGMLGVALPALAFEPGAWNDGGEHFAVPPFHPRVHAPVATSREMLAMSDADLLAVCSTSPLWEDERFVADVRAALQSLISGAWRTAFPGGKAAVYHKDPQGLWAK